jgi:hypothetical protein
MSQHNELIPRPPVVRERLAESLREARLLRRLLRLSETAAIERYRQSDHQPDAAPSKEVVS